LTPYPDLVAAALEGAPSFKFTHLALRSGIEDSDGIWLTFFNRDKSHPEKDRLSLEHRKVPFTEGDNSLARVATPSLHMLVAPDAKFKINALSDAAPYTLPELANASFADSNLELDVINNVSRGAEVMRKLRELATHLRTMMWNDATDLPSYANVERFLAPMMVPLIKFWDKRPSLVRHQLKLEAARDNYITAILAIVVPSEPLTNLYPTNQVFIKHLRALVKAQFAAASWASNVIEDQELNFMSAF